MAIQSASALRFAAAAIIMGVAAPSASYALDGPRLVEKTLNTSDVQYSFERSADGKTLSVAFDNFAVALPARSPAPAMRVLPLRIAVADAGKGATLRFKARGALACPAGITCLGILWVNGQTQVFTLTPGKKPSAAMVEAAFPLPGAEAYQAAVILVAERDMKKRDCAATISVSSLELTIEPPPAEAGPGKK